MTDLVGQTLLERYRIDKFLGRGGMAEVYRAWDVKRSVYVALKVLNEDLSDDYVFLNRFSREARALELIQHPNIVRFFGFEESQDGAFLVMEYIDGTTLRRQLKLLKRPLSLPEALSVLQPVCSALHYAHQMGIYHCDVKPANIFIERGGRVVLGDFGIARLSESATVTFSTPGTPAYMAPEQCRGEEVDARTDVYSLGVTTYEILTLDRPFKGETEGTTGSRGERVRWEQMNVPPLPPRRINPDISPVAEAAILRALEKEPQQRQQGGLAFYKEFSADEQPVPFDEISWTEDQRRTTLQPPATPQKRMGLFAILGGIGALFLFVLLFKLVTPQSTKVEDATSVEELVAQLTVDAATANARATLDHSKTTPTPVPEDTPTNSLPATDTPQPSSTYTPEPIIHTSTPTYVSSRTMTPSPTASHSETPLRIVFVLGSPRDTDIYLIDSNGSNRRQIAGSGYDEAEPDWSPDENYIAYQSNGAGNYDIWIIDINGRQQQQLTTTSVDEREPNWSPNGQQIIYRRGGEPNGDGELWVMDHNGRNQHRLGKQIIKGRSPVWSPDGRQVAFMSERSGSWDIYLFDLNNDDVRRLTHCAANCRFPNWSPDGQFVLYHSTRSVSSFTPAQIWRQRADGGGSAELVAEGDNPGRAVWSVEGVIAFNTDDGIDIVNADSSNRHMLRNSDDGWAPDWSR
jgi:serine/threonine protein kinase